MFPSWEYCGCSRFGNNIYLMQVLSLRTLRRFWERHPKAKRPLRAWYKIVSEAKWDGPADVKGTFRTADFVGDKRIVFDIGGNKYRIVARVVYDPFYRVMIKFVGTHEEYDRINPETV
jgi:mRNA interferase HigB